MTMTTISFFAGGNAARVSAGITGLGVILGAVAAHALKAQLAQRENGAETWRTAVLYHMLHGLVLLWIAGHRQKANRCAWWLMLAGIMLFSGSLYPYTLTGVKWLAYITPFGGLFFIAGWISLAIRPSGEIAPT